MPGFTYKINFLDEDERFLELDRHDVEVDEQPEHPEGEEDQARDKAHRWAEGELEARDADDYELELENAW